VRRRCRGTDGVSGRLDGPRRNADCPLLLSARRHIAAANRAQEVVRKYDQAPAVEDALAIVVLAYDRLGMTELRDDAKRVLDRNFPNSNARAEGTETRQRSWWQVWK